MSIDEFRRMALSFPEAEESAHIDHPDFRVRGKIFATLGYPADGWGMVALSATDQQLLVAAQPGVFVPAKGAWGRRGATTVLLKAAKTSTVRNALAAAWRSKAPQSLARPRR